MGTVLIIVMKANVEATTLLVTMITENNNGPMCHRIS